MLRRIWMVALAFALGWGGWRAAWADALEDRDPVFLAGRAALEDGLNDLAQKRFEEYIRNSLFRGRRALGMLYLVQALNAQGKNDEAMRWFDEHKAWMSTEYEPSLLFWRARVLFDLGRLGEALDELQVIDDRFSRDPIAGSAMRLRAQVYVKMNQLDKALAEMAEFDAKHGSSKDAADNLLDWASLLIRRNESAQAEAILRRLLDQHPTAKASRQADLWLGQLLAARGAWAEADPPLAALSANAQADADLRAGAWIARATIREATSNYLGAVEACLEGEKLARDPAVQLHGKVIRARALARLDRRAEAIQTLDDAIRRYPGQPERGDALIQLAGLLLEEGQPERALDAYQKYLEAFTDPRGEERALMGKGQSLWDLGRFAEAAVSFEKAYAAQSNSALRVTALVKAADASFAAGQYGTAQQDYIKAKDEFPDNEQVPDWLIQIAECDARLKRYREAEGGLRFIIEQYPESDIAERAVMRLAGMKEAQGLWEDAAMSYDDLMLMFPKSARWPEALLGRGIARYHAGLFPEARADFDQVVDKFSNTAWAEQAYYLRAWCLYLQGDVKAGLQEANDFLARFPNSVWAPDVLFWLAEHRFNTGEMDEAEKLFTRVAKLYPRSAMADNALYWAGRTAFQKNDYKRAISYYNDLAANYTNSPRIAEARFAQGDALTELGEFSGAIIAFDEVIKRFPNSPLADLAMGRKGDCQFTLGADRPERLTEAVGSYRAVMDSQTAAPNLKLQAEFKMGRCFEKMNRRSDAFEHYMNVVYGWLAARDAGQMPDQVWFIRSAFAAAALKEADGAREEAARIYQRVVDAGVPAGPDAQKQIDKLKEPVGAAGQSALK